MAGQISASLPASFPLNLALQRKRKKPNRDGDSSDGDSSDGEEYEESAAEYNTRLLHDLIQKLTNVTTTLNELNDKIDTHSKQTVQVKSKTEPSLYPM